MIVKFKVTYDVGTFKIITIEAADDMIDAWRQLTASAELPSRHGVDKIEVYSVD